MIGRGGAGGLGCGGRYWWWAGGGGVGGAGGKVIATGAAGLGDDLDDARSRRRACVRRLPGRGGGDNGEAGLAGSGRALSSVGGQVARAGAGGAAPRRRAAAAE